MGYDFLQGRGTFKEIETELCRIFEYTTAQGDNLQVGQIHNPSKADRDKPCIIWVTRLCNGELSDIECVLIQRRVTNGLDCWGYKTMSLASGPFYYSCPHDWVDAYVESDTTWKSKGFRKWIIEYRKKHHKNKLAGYTVRMWD